MKIAWLSNAPWSHTGYGNQTAVFTPRIRDLGHELAVIAFYGLEGAVLNWNGIKVYPRAFHLYGQDIMAAHTRNFGGDIMISLMDSWVVEPQYLIQGVLWVPWFPVDHSPLPPPVQRNISKAYKRIVFSRFGERMVREAGQDCYYVPHGIDTKVFAPADKKEACERTGLPSDRFIFGMVAANKGAPSRKAFQQHLEAFAMVHKRHPDTLLYLHTDKGESGANSAVNLPEFIHFLGIDDAVMFCDQYTNVSGFPNEFMRDVYNAMDVHVLVSMGEGFGIPTVEAQACGTPVITSEWSASGELCFGGWIVPESKADKWWTPLGAYQWMPRSQAIAAAMEEAYRKAGKQYREKARQGALAYDADLVTEQYWKPVLEEIEREIKRGDKLELVKF